MKVTAAFFIFLVATLRAGEVILPYSTFGPQSAAYDLIGMEWWQWDSHGDSQPREYPIKVIVFWDQTQEETAKRYPVDKAKFQDFRYAEYSIAIEHLGRTITEFQKAGIDSHEIEQTLALLKNQKAEQDAAANP